MVARRMRNQFVGRNGACLDNEARSAAVAAAAAAAAAEE
jgi:hypothetical protein